MKNKFLEYYKQNKISPVSQDISDLSLHIRRRNRLYALLGINADSFKGAKILEVGAGSGYNTLVFLLAGAKVDIVEPNPTGRKEMKKLFGAYNIDSKQYRIYECVIEEFKNPHQYDFVIAEGFLPAFDEAHRAIIMDNLYRCAKNGGYIVITTICEFSYFFEYLRIILGLTLVLNIKDFNAKSELLAEAFLPHLNALKFASRPIRDWVMDSILNPINDTFSFSISDGIIQMQRSAGRGNIEVINTSPNLICNLSWYKNVEYSYANEIVKVFPMKRHLLLCTKFSDSLRDGVKNNMFLSHLVELRQEISEYRESGDIAKLVPICKILQVILETNGDFGEFFSKSVEEVIWLLQNPESICVKSVANMQYFSEAWGRGAQYISFQKLENNIY